MRVLLIHNPRAGDEDHTRERLEQVVRESGHEVRYGSTEDGEWATALEWQPELIAIAGGDGTVREALSALAGHRVTATILPTGSANNIARTLGYPGDDASRLVGAWSSATLEPYDVWTVDGLDRRFVESMGSGIFAEVLARAKDVDDASVDKVELGLNLLEEIVDEAPVQTWELTLDGETLREPLLGFEAMNIRELGPNLALAPQAEPGDGLLDVVLVRAEHRAALSAYVAARARRAPAEPPRLEVRRARRVAVSLIGDSPLRLDDELVDGVPAGAALECEAEARLELLVPKLVQREAGV